MNTNNERREANRKAARERINAMPEPQRKHAKLRAQALAKKEAGYY